MFVFALFSYSRSLEMEEATIEDEPDVEQTDRSSRPETSTGLLPWSYIFQIGISSQSFVVTSLHFVCSHSILVSQQWAVFLIISLAVAAFLYISARQQRMEKRTTSSIRNDHIQSGNSGQAISRKSTNKRD